MKFSIVDGRGCGEDAYDLPGSAGKYLTDGRGCGHGERGGDGDGYGSGTEDGDGWSSISGHVYSERYGNISNW